MKRHWYTWWLYILTGGILGWYYTVVSKKKTERIVEIPTEEQKGEDDAEWVIVDLNDTDEE